MFSIEPDYPRRAKREKSPEREVDPEEQYEILKELFPDADPTYLHMQANNLAHQPAQLKEFINYALEHRNYPTMKEYLRYSDRISVVNYQVLFLIFVENNNYLPNKNNTRKILMLKILYKYFLIQKQRSMILNVLLKWIMNR